MEKRALLIGSPTGGLLAVESDLDEMTTLLAARGFQCRRCYREDATRQGILAAYQSLVADTAEGDAAVVYYTGHGGRASVGSGSPHQFICPWDFGATTAHDFRGVLALELSHLLAQLTARTTNVTAIFDCCHAAGMSRSFGAGTGLRPRSRPDLWELGVQKHLESLCGRGLAIDRLDAVGNPHAVRLVATAGNQLAFEFDDERGRARGLLTWALCATLSEAGGRPINWQTAIERIRRLVQSRAASQRPEAEGPSDRVVFEATGLPGHGLPVVVDAGQVFLGGGRVHGVEIGDVYRILADPAAGGDAQPVAEATVERVETARSLVSLHTSLPAGASLRAVALRLGGRRWTVDVRGTSPTLDQLRTALSATGLIRPQADADGEHPLATVEEVGESVLIRDPGGQVVVTRPAVPAAVAVLVQDLQSLARARALVTLPDGVGPAALPRTYQIEWGRVVGGKRTTAPDRETPLRVGELLFVGVKNTGPQPLYVQFFDVGLAKAITLLNRSYPSGVEVAPGGEYVLGASIDHQLTGLPLLWPTDLPRGEPREETVVVLVFDRPCPLDNMEQAGIRSRSLPAEQTRFWQALLSGRRHRDLGEPDLADVRYSVEPLTFAVASPP